MSKLRQERKCAWEADGVLERQSRHAYSGLR